MIDNDSFQKFLFETLQIRGEWVRLNSSFKQAVGEKIYASSVKNLLGQTAAASVLLTGTLKFEGRLSIHARGEGPISLLMAEATDTKAFRCIAVNDDRISEGSSLSQLLGKAQLAITISPDKGSRYQGVVPLDRGSMADCLVQYFELSEQLDTYFMLATEDDACYGLMLQKLPGYREIEDQDAWNRITQLVKTLNVNEIKAADNQTLIHRLFHEDAVLVFERESVNFECSCSRERSLSSLETLGQKEALSILESEAVIGVDCQFCNRRYEFDRNDVGTLFGLGPAH